MVPKSFLGVKELVQENQGKGNETKTFNIQLVMVI